MKPNPLNPLDFLNLSKPEQRKFLEEQTRCIAHLHQLGSDLLEWTEEYHEDEVEQI